MTPEHWQQLKSIFAAVEEFPREQWAAFLDRACTGDPALRSEVEVLLQRHDQARSFLEQPAIGFLQLWERMESATTPSDAPIVESRTGDVVSSAPNLRTEKIGPYEIIATLGRGGMGIVYKARDTRLRRLVALKVLPSAKIADEERKQRFVKEARAASALNHPNIITIYEIGSTSEQAPYIAMEYIAGGTLRQMLADGALAFSSVLAIAVQIAEGLAAAHESGIVHRDLKPENVMLDTKARVKILDFGLAKLVSPEETMNENVAHVGTASITRSGEILGTVNYISPEQACGKTVDFRSDQFSFGVLLYEMLTSKRPFERPSIVETLAAAIREQPPAISQVNPQVPPPLQCIVERCLAKEPQQRYSTTADLVQDLALLHDPEVKTRGTAPVAPSVPLIGRETEVRFVQNSISEPAVEPPLSSSFSSSPSGWRVARGYTSLGALALSIVLASLTFFLWRGERAPSFYSAVPLTTYIGSQIQPSFAPDGERIAFAWDGEKQDNFDIYVKQIGVAEPIRLTNDPRPDLSPAWSPDGRSIAFVRVVSVNQAEILLMPALTGHPVRRLTEIAAAPSSYSDIRFLAWSPDGKCLVVSDAPSSGASRGLFLVSAETGEKRRLTLPPPQYDDLDPIFSVDMSRLVFARHSEAGTSDLYFLSFSKGFSPQGEPKRMTFYGRRATSPAWAQDGRIVFARSNEVGTHTLWRMPASTPGSAEALPIAAERSSTLALSPQGKRLVYSRERRDTQLWGVELPGSEHKSAGPTKPQPWIVSSGEDMTPQFSPNGQQIAFQSTRSGFSEIWLADRDGSNSRQLTDFRAGIEGFPRWSPDGNKIVFHSRQKTDAALFILDIRGGRPERLTTEPGDDTTPSWSHDGKWIFVLAGPEIFRSGKYRSRAHPCCS